MNTYRIKLEVELELDAFTAEDAVDLAKDSIYDTEGLGVAVIDVTVTGKSER